MKGRRKTWIGVTAAVLMVALLASSAPVAAAGTPAVATEDLAFDAWSLPEGAGITPLPAEALQATEGEMIQAVIVGARLAVSCARSAACRAVAVRAGKVVAKAVRVGLEAAGAYYTVKSLKEDLGW